MSNVNTTRVCAVCWRAVAVVLGEAGHTAPAEAAEEAARTLEMEEDARRQWDEARETSRALLTGGHGGGNLGA